MNDLNYSCTHTLLEENSIITIPVFKVYIFILKLTNLF